MPLTGNILAIRLSVPDPQEVLPWSGVQFRDGWRTLMSVTSIVAKVQTTVFFGNSLYMIWYNIGQMSPQDGFTAFLKTFYNRPLYFSQLSTPPFAAVPGQYRRLVQTPPPNPPVSMGVMTMLNSGFDPFRGYWVEFLGNYFLTIPIFPNYPVVRDGPNYQGFQPSQNNPGSGNPGSMPQGGNC